MARFKIPVEAVEEISKKTYAAGEIIEDTSLKRTSPEEFAKTSALPDVIERRGLKPNEVQEVLVEAERKKTAITSKKIAERQEVFNKLTPEQRRDYNTLVTYGRDYQVEFDGPEGKNILDSWGIDDATQTAYNGYIEDSRYKYAADSELHYKNLKKTGWKTSSKTGDTIKETPRNVLNSQKFSQMSILDDETGDILSYRNTSIEDLDEKFFNKGYKLYQVYPVEADRLGYTHYLTKNPDEIMELSKWTLPYVKGGSNAYTPDTHFLKIGRDFYDKEGSRLFHGFPKTLVADENARRLEKMADEINQVSEMWKNSQGDLAALQRELNEANFQEFKVNSAEDVKNLMKTRDNPDGVIDPNYKAQVLRNNEKYVYGDQGAAIEQLEDFDLEMSNLMEIKGTYYRGRGDRILANLTNDYGHVVDPFTMQQRNIEQAVYNNTLGRFLSDFGDYFKDNYAAVIDNQKGKYNINKMSGQEVIASAIIKAPNSDYDEMARAARRAQLMYQNLVNTPTKLDVWLSTKMTDMLHRLPKRFWDNRYMDGLLRSKPIDWANALVYRAYLGLFNAKQFVLQGPLQMFNILSFAPVKGTQALVSLPAIIMGHFFKDTPVIKQIPKLLAGLGGISQKEYEGFLKFMDDYGTFKQFSKRPELTESMESWLKTHSQIDLIFAQAGNNLSQLHADLTAYLIDGGKNMRNICRMSDDFMLNLNRANTSMAQRSFIGKLAAQFTSYPIAAYEIMTGDHLTKWQRARFTAMQLGMWGIGGTFAKDYITNMYDFIRDRYPEADPEILTYALEGIGTKFFADQGIYINEGTNFLGIMNQMSSLVPVMNEIFGTAPELPISNVPTIIVDSYNAAKDLIAPRTGVYDFISWARETSQKRGIPSGPKNFLKFIYAKDAKQFIDRHGNVLRRNPEVQQYFAQLIGFGNIESVMDYRSVQRDNIIREAIREHFEEEVLPYIRKMIDYRDTPQSYGTELARTSERGLLYGNTKAAVERAYAWIRETRPSYEPYLTSLITKAWKSGGYKEYRRTEQQQEHVKEMEKNYNQE